MKNNTEPTPTHQPQTPQKRFMTPKELASEYSFSTSTQAKLRMKNKIPFSKIGRYIRYDRIEIDKWIENNKVEMKA
ncbi:MAG: Unknown protein [uncultured Sulfurovum sp.]|uniref:Helix-turn-helix domain-containing protein n=1 Tax=uncultured Sulfurovum sp. TaxID=269237 RepID=A0A6S6S6N0_9BACT|nr:MAG: Unknown protein [uncultured Sulfurovum sp.]